MVEGLQNKVQHDSGIVCSGHHNSSANNGPLHILCQTRACTGSLVKDRGTEVHKFCCLKCICEKVVGLYLNAGKCVSHMLTSDKYFADLLRFT